MTDRFLSALELAVWLQPTFASNSSGGFRLRHNRTDGRVLVLPLSPGPEGLIVLSPRRGILLLRPEKAGLIAWEDYDRNGARTIAAAVRAFYTAQPGTPAPDFSLALLHGLLALGAADSEHSWDVAVAGLDGDGTPSGLPGWQLWRDLQPVLSIQPDGFFHYPDGTASGFHTWNTSLGSVWRLVLRVALTIDRRITADAG